MSATSEACVFLVMSFHYNCYFCLYILWTVLIIEYDFVFKQSFLLFSIPKTQYHEMTRMDLDPYSFVSLFARSLSQGMKATREQGKTFSFVSCQGQDCIRALLLHPPCAYVVWCLITLKLIGVQIFWVQTILLHGTEAVSGKINTWRNKKLYFTATKTHHGY
jgi:hypothetical protein